MGCSSSEAVGVGPRLSLEEEMERQKRNLDLQIDENNIKIMGYEREIEDFNNQIKEKENEVKLNGYALSEAEINSKIKKLMDLQKDRARIQRSLDSLKNLNETLKNNLENVKKKLEEQRVVQTLKDGTQLMNKIDEGNNDNIMNTNAKNLLKQRVNDDQTQKNLERLNNAYSGSDVPNLDDYKKQLLGTGGTPGF